MRRRCAGSCVAVCSTLGVAVGAPAFADAGISAIPFAAATAARGDCIAAGARIATVPGVATAACRPPRTPRACNSGTSRWQCSNGSSRICPLIRCAPTLQFVRAEWPCRSTSHNTTRPGHQVSAGPHCIVNLSGERFSATRADSGHRSKRGKARQRARTGIVMTAGSLKTAHAAGHSVPSQP